MVGNRLLTALLLLSSQKIFTIAASKLNYDHEGVVPLTTTTTTTTRSRLATTAVTAKSGIIVQQGSTVRFPATLKYKDNSPGFETVVSYDGTVLAIGFSPNNFQFPDDDCRVYVYRMMNPNTNQSKWVQTGYFTRAVTSNKMLWGKVALSGDGQVLAIRTRGNTTGLVMVYRFQSSNNKWVPRGYVSSPTRDYYFGYSLTMSSNGSILAVGTNNGYGRVDTFRWNGTVWGQRGKPFKYFVACSMSQDGNVVAVFVGSYDSFSTFRFNASVAGGWIQIGSFIDAPDGYHFGVTTGIVSLSGNGKRVAAFGDSNYPPFHSILIVREYNPKRNEWESVGPGATQLIDGDSVMNPSITLSNDGSLVAELQGPVHDDTGEYPGEVHVYNVTNNGTWPRIYRYDGPYIAPVRGRSAAISGDGKTLVVANFGFDTYRVLSN